MLSVLCWYKKTPHGAEVIPEVTPAENSAPVESPAVIKSATPTSSFHLSGPEIETLRGFNRFVSYNTIFLHLFRNHYG